MENENNIEGTVATEIQFVAARDNFELGTKEGVRAMLDAEEAHTSGRAYGKRRTSKLLRGGVPTGDAEFLAWASA